MKDKILKPVNPEKKKRKKEPIIDYNDNFLKFIYNNKKIKDINKDNKSK